MALCEIDPQSMLVDAYYVDEAGPVGPCQSGRRFRISRFVKTDKTCNKFYSRSACLEARNPLIDPGLPFPEDVPPAKRGKLKDKLEAPRRYHIYVSPGLIDKYLERHEAPQMPRAKVSVFFGVGPEIALFGLRSFFEPTPDGALITVPGIEAGWKGYGAAWGIGVDARLIDNLLIEAGLIGQAWDLHVLAGYSTGYRGLNGTICNAQPLGLKLDTVERMTVFDCLYHGDDNRANNRDPAYAQRYTQRAIDGLLQASSDAEIAVFRVTSAGTPGGAYGHNLRAQIPKRNLTLIDFLKRGLFDKIRAICLSRFIQNAMQAGIVKQADMPPPVDEFIKLLPARGGFTTRPGGAGVDLFKWLARKDVKLRIGEIYQLRHGPRKIIDHLIDLTMKHGLLGGWESDDFHDMMHRYFVQEFGKEYLV